MRFLSLAKRNKEASESSWRSYYESEIVRMIRKKYSLDEELAILRQREEKADEFAEYNLYVESCKQYVKDRIAE